MTQPRLQSLSDIAAYLEHVLEENQKLERLLNEAIRERITLHLQYVEANAGLEKRQTEYSAREKLTRDDFERRIQEVQTQFMRERHQLQKLVRSLKTDLDSCICKGNDLPKAMRKIAPAPAAAPAAAPVPVSVPVTAQASEANTSTANRHDAARARQQAWLQRNSK